jgi:hypothetical protein
LKIAFIILAYKNPVQLGCLVKTLVHDDHWFFVHIDKTKSIEPFKKELDSVTGANIVYVEREKSYWGSYNCVKALINGMKFAFEHEVSFDYFIHLSGQDFPVTGLHRIRETLESSAPSSFMYHFALPAPNWDFGGLNRLQSCLFYVGRKRIVLTNKTQNLLYRFLYKLWRVFVDSFDKGRTFYGGEIYFMLHKNAIKHFFENLTRERLLRNRLKYTLIPEEIYIPTMLLQRNGNKILPIENRTLRYINWEGRGKSPKIINEDDMESIRSGEFLFARKFDFEANPHVRELILDHIKSQKITL